METLKVLLLEDNANDVEFVKNEIISSLQYSIQCKWVISKEDYLEEVKRFYPDIILSDFKLPQFDGLEAVKLLNEINPDIPFIIVTGTLTEEAAAESIKSGAWDYVVKERLHRLPQAIMNALKLKSERLKARKAELELRLIKEKTGIQVKLLYDAINHAPSSVVITDAMGTILFVNPNFEEVTGYKSEEAVGQNPRILKSGVHDKAFYAELWNTLLQGKDWKGEIVNRKKNGELYWEQVSISPITDDQGNILHYVAIKHDISEIKDKEKQLKESEEKFRLIANSAKDGIIMINDRGEINYWNPGAEMIFGYSFAEVQNQNLHHLVAPAKYLENYLTAFKQFGKTGDGSALGKILEVQAIRRDGTLIDVELSLARMDLPSGYGAVGIVRDVSERKRIELDLLQAKEKAEESDRLKSAFLTAMSHELRTPLNSVIGFSGLINRNLPPQDIDDMAQIVKNSGKHLLRIIDSIFEITLLESRETIPFIEEFPAHELFSNLRAFLNDELTKQKKKGLEVIYRPQENTSALKLKSDYSKLLKLMSNLLHNAVKFTETGKIEYGYAVSGQEITFFVKDTGIGIPADRIGIIFERFRQVDETHTRKHGGVGLGLAICKEIARLLNGSFRVESEPGAGSTFYFRLPGAAIVPEIQPGTKTAETGLPSLEGITLLVVEDEEYNFLFLKTILSGAKATVLPAVNGRDAVEMCENHPEIDLVLMDIKMPVMTGDEATQKIKEKRADLPVIAQTAYATKAEIEKYMAIGFDDYITKPISKDRLIRMIASSLSV